MIVPVVQENMPVPPNFFERERPLPSLGPGKIADGNGNGGKLSGFQLAETLVADCSRDLNQWNNDGGCLRGD